MEYERRSPGGLQNQGWKDSHDSVVHADGSLAEGPIALVEVQGYVYMAKLTVADVYDAFGDGARAGRLRDQAAALRAAFNQAFWNPEEGRFALALDGHKRQVASVTSNPGHCLYCGIVDPDKAGAVRLEGLRVGDATVTLAFEREGAVTGFALVEQRGELSVTMAASESSPSR